MRIALVSREVVPFFGAGIGTYAAEMSRAWADAGHEVHFLSQDHEGFAARGPRELGAACHIVSPRRDTLPFAAHAKGVRRALVALHARSPLDYIEFPDYWAEGYFAMVGARVRNELKGAVLGIRLHTPTFECRVFNGESTEEEADLQRAEEKSIALADLVTSPSRSLLERVQSRITIRSPTAVVPYPFRVDCISAPAPIATNRPTVLYFGRLERRKGVELLVQAGQSLLQAGTDVQFRLIGGDTQTGPGGRSMLAHLRDMVAPPWRNHFAFESRRPRAELFNIIRGVSEGGGVCCFPSLWENFPNVCLEAMSLGACVVGSDAGGMAEIISDGDTGVLFRAGDAASLAGALARALNDGQMRQTIATSAPGRIESLCDPPTIVALMTEAIESARTAQKRPPPPTTIGGALLRMAFSVLHGR